MMRPCNMLLFAAVERRVEGGKKAVFIRTNERTNNKPASYTESTSPDGAYLSLLSVASEALKCKGIVMNTNLPHFSFMRGQPHLFSFLLSGHSL